MALTNKIFVQVDNEKIELTGKAKEEYLKDIAEIKQLDEARKLEEENERLKQIPVDYEIFHD